MTGFYKRLSLVSVLIKGAIQWICVGYTPLPLDLNKPKELRGKELGLIFQKLVQMFHR